MHPPAPLRAGRHLFDMVYVAASDDPVACAHGLPLPAQARLDRAELDALLVPGFWTESPEQADAALADNAELVAGIKRLARCVMVWSYCTGISADLGFSSDAGMRRMFKEPTGMTTAQYRQAFGRN